MENKRKVVQIAFEEHPEEIASLYALCDDGTVWCRRAYAEWYWINIDAIVNGEKDGK